MPLTHHHVAQLKEAYPNSPTVGEAIQVLQQQYAKGSNGTELAAHDLAHVIEANMTQKQYVGERKSPLQCIQVEPSYFKTEEMTRIYQSAFERSSLSGEELKKAIKADCRTLRDKYKEVLRTANLTIGTHLESPTAFYSHPEGTPQHEQRTQEITTGTHPKVTSQEFDTHFNRAVKLRENILKRFADNVGEDITMEDLLRNSNPLLKDLPLALFEAPKIWAERSNTQDKSTKKAFF